jgi:photosystem II stability/assembly factor-like uncharacterized protein
MRRLFYFVIPVLSFGFGISAFAQESENPENEFLKEPVLARHDVGLYREINSLPESVRRSKAFARGLHEIEHYAGMDGTYDRQARIDAFEKSKADIARAAWESDKVSGSKLPVFADAWSNIGPANTAGMTKSLAFDPTNGSIIYAGAVAGGVWKTTNSGTKWVPLTDLVIPDLSVASIAVDPNSPNTIYVGSGDPSLSSDAFPGTGLYKTTDGGTTWAAVGAAKLTGTVDKVLVDPVNSNIILAAAYPDGIYNGTAAIYRSINAGVTFTKVYPAGNTYAKAVIWDMAIGDVIAGKQTFYMVEGNNVGATSTESGIYKSLDDGATWTKISTAGLPNGSTIGKAALAIPKGDPTKIYCLMANPNGDIDGTSNLPGLWKSIDAGFTFTQVKTVPSTLFNATSGAQGWYDLYLGITPNSVTTDTLYIGGIEGYRSFNSGSTWSVYSSYQINGLHVDNQSVAVDPINSRNVMVGTDGGVYRSTNAGVSWTYSSDGMETMRFYHIGLDALDHLKTYGGAQDQGVRKLVTGQAAAFIYGGDGFQPIIDPTNSNIYYFEGPFGDISKSTDGGNNYFSVDDQAFIQGSPTYDPSDWETPVAMSPQNHLTIFTGREHLWRTVDGGNSWATVSPTFTYNNFNYFVESIGLSPSNANYFWAGLEGGKIWLTNNAGNTWTDKSNGLPGYTVKSIVCSPTDQNWALAAFATWGTASARVMRTTNGGTNWTNVSGSGLTALPGVPVNCVAIDSISPSTTWYAATDNGIYYTRDAGSTWSIAGSGLGLAACTDVQIHANKTTIRVGTHGRSIWEGNVNVLPVELTGLTGTKTTSGTNLLWKTASEHDDSGFWIERSYNYMPFVDISFVPGAGTSNSERAYSYLDTKQDNGVYIYRLNQVDLDGSSHLSNTVEVIYGSVGTGLELGQNFPNPFIAGYSLQGSTRIQFQLSAPDVATLTVSSISGAVVRTLLDHVQTSIDEQDIFWDGKDNNGVPVASGVYNYKLETASGEKMVKKLVIISK